MGVEPAIMIRNITRVNVNSYNYRNYIVKQTGKLNYNQRWHIESFFLLLKGILMSILLVKH